jgi:hypothetical protein
MDALAGLAACVEEESRVFRLGPLAVRLETRREKTPEARANITEAAQRLADQVRTFNFKDALDVGLCHEALCEARQASASAQEEALDALESMIAQAPQRTPASAARSYSLAAQHARSAVPNMIHSQV